MWQLSSVGFLSTLFFKSLPWCHVYMQGTHLLLHNWKTQWTHIVTYARPRQLCSCGLQWLFEQHQSEFHLHSTSGDHLFNSVTALKLQLLFSCWEVAQVELEQIQNCSSESAGARFLRDNTLHFFFFCSSCWINKGNKYSNYSTSPLGYKTL